MHLLLFLTFLLTPLISLAVPKFDEQKLIDTAEYKGYGYKFANLVELDKLAQWFNKEAKAPLVIKIPEFFGVSSDRILNQLKDQGFDVSLEWAKVLSTISLEEQVQAFKTKVLPEKFWIERRKFEDVLFIYFEQMIEEVKDINFSQISNTIDADHLLRHANLSKNTFMVRSTGKEDTRFLANAGGNKSIANVLPDKPSLWRAAEEVVLSYFSEKSLKQRLNAGDKTLFSTEVFIPVLFQLMVGEQKQIPICGVMFTEEPEGAISFKNEEREESKSTDKIVTTGITIIQAAYGHNEGVVNSQVVVDTVIAQGSGLKLPIFYPVIRAKHERMAPVPGLTKLAKEENPANLVMKPALDNDMLITLKMFSNALESYYGYPVDVEFVINKKIFNNIINIVQARPIVHKESLRKPSYLPELKNLPKEKIFTGITIGAARGRGVEAKKSELIIAPNINIAFNIYQNHNSPVSIKAVVIGTNAPSTSHEATIFRGDLKPVIYIRNLDNLINNFTDDKTLFISPQQHSAVIVDHDEQITWREGWFAYPLPSELSVTNSLFLNSSKTPWYSYSSSKNLNFIPWSKLIEVIRTGKTKAVINALEHLQIQLDQEINKFSDHLTKDEDLSRQISGLQNAIAVISQRIIKTADIQEEDPLYITRLLPINYLEALIKQQINTKEIFNPLSIATTLNTLKLEAKKTIRLNYGSSESEQYFNQLKKVSENIFDQKTKDAWMLLISTLAKEPDPSLAAKLGLLISQLAEFDLLQSWLHSTMVNDIYSFTKSDKPIKTYQKLIESWIQPLVVSHDFLAQVKLLRKRIAEFPVNNFDDPEKFESAWGQLKKTIVKNITSINFKRNFDTANSTAKLAASYMFNQFIDLFDRNIKTLKSSSNYDINNKLLKYRRMLLEYNILLRHFFHFIIPLDYIYFPEKSQLDSYLTLIETILKREFTEIDLLPTPEVETFNFSIGSGHDFVADSPYTIQPASAEDAFSIIHQSLIHGVGILATRSGLLDIRRPQLLSEIETIYKYNNYKIAYIASRPMIAGIDVTTKGITILYNVPLGSHSCQIKLEYVHKTNSVQIELHFAGGVISENHRWYYGAALTVLTSASEQYRSLEPKLIKLSDHALVVTFLAKPPADLPKLKFLLELLLKDATTCGAFYELNRFIEYRAIPTGPFDLKVVTQFDLFNEIGYRAKMAFFRLTVEKGHGFLEATKVAVDGIISPIYDISMHAFYLFEMLFGKSHGFSEAIDVVISNKVDAQLSAGILKSIFASANGKEALRIKKDQLLKINDLPAPIRKFLQSISSQ